MKLISYTLISALLSFWFGEPKEQTKMATPSSAESCQEVAPSNTYSLAAALAPLYEQEAASKMPLPLKVMAPSITATKTFMLVGTDNAPTGPSPGDMLEYTVAITNGAGAMDATGTKFVDTIDPNTTLVPGSVKTSVVAVNDSYSTVGNVSISVPAGSGLTVNDVNLDGDVLTVTTVNTAGTMGDVTFNANGSFTFNPAPGFEGPTTFTYTVSDGMFSSTGTVTVTVTGMIWFINAAAPAGGDGRLSTPFNNMNSFNGSSLDGTGDNIFVYSGTYTNTTSTILLGNQNLIGQGAVGTLATLAGVTFSVHPPSGNPVPSAGGTNPIINQAGNSLTLGSNNDVLGVTVNNTSGTTFNGTSFGTLFLRNVTLSNSNGTAVNLNTGVLNAIFTSISAAGSGDDDYGIRIQNTTGAVEVTGSGTTDGSGGTISNIVRRGIELITVTNVTLRNMTLTNANTGDAGFDGTCDEDQNTSCYAAIHMQAVNGMTMNNVDVTTTNEQGVNGNNVTNLVMTNCTITGAGTAGVSTEENGLKLLDLFGTCSFTGCTFSQSAARNTHIRTSSGTLNLTVTDCNFSNTTFDIVRIDCFEMRTIGTASATVNITNSSFNRAGSKAMQCLAEGSSTFNLNVSNCTMQRFGNTMAGIETGSVGTATMNYNITNNPAIEAQAEVAVLTSTFNNSQINGRINNNASISHLEAAPNTFSNIRVLHEGNGTAKVEVLNNPAVTSTNLDIPVFAAARVGTTAASRLDFSLEGNTISNATGSAPLEGIELRSGTSVGGSSINTICSSIRQNAVTLATGTPRVLRYRFLDAGIARFEGPGPDLATNWSSNLNTHTPAGAAITSSGTLIFNDACPNPTHPTFAPEAEQVVALGAELPADREIAAALPQQQTVESTTSDITTPETLQALTVMSGETVTVGGMPGFPLPAGQTMTIVFRVTIDNDPFPLGVCQVSNQGTVMGSNFSNVLTDDPGVAGTANPTVTTLNIAPTITLCQTNITSGTDLNLCTANEVFLATAVGCPTPTVTYRIGMTVITSPYVFPIGTTTVDVTASNGVMPNATCSFTVTVTDTQAPDITCLVGTQTRGTNLGNCTYTVQGSEFNPSVNENCPGFTLTNNFNNTNTLAGAMLPIGTTAIVWTITDGAMQTDMCTVTVQVADDDTPSITCPAPTSTPCNIADLPPYANLTAFTNAGGTTADNCGINPASFMMLSQTGGPLSYVRTYQIADVNGLTSTCTQTVTVSDNVPPTVTAGTIASCYPTLAAAEAAAIAATTATDNCMGTVTKTASTVGTCMAVITVTGTDGASNSAFVTYNTRIDNTPPMVTTGMIANCYPTVAAAEAAALAATSATDNCPGTLTETASTVGTCMATITVTTTDGCGNSTPVTYNTSIDNASPTVSTGTIAACYPTVAAAEAAAIAATTAMDDCPSTIVKTASTVGTCSAVVTVTATDACGNSAMTTYNTRIDNTPPVATAGTIAACYPTVAAAEAAALAATSATDNCPGTLTETASTVGTCSAVVTVTTSDGCGNSTTTTYNTRIDNTPPVATAGTIAACYATVAAAEAAALAATTATDNCPGTLTETASTVGTCSAVVTVTTTDGCGNSTMTTYNTRIDNTPPVATAGMIASCYATVAAAEAAALAATTATDNCPGTLTETASTVGTCSAVITVTTSDGCGNSTTTTYNTRIDNTPPVVTTGTIANCYPTVAAAEAAALAATSATDNCPGTLTETASTVGTCSAVITVTTTDGCGNSTPVTYNTRIDNAGPTVMTGTIAACYPTVAAAEAAAIAATTAMDDCPSSVVKTASTVGTCSAVVTVTATDGCGNSAMTTYNTRIDNTAPTVTPGSIAACYMTVAAAEAAAIAATTAMDNCPGTVTKTASTVGTCSAIITVTGTDGCGNSATTTYNTRIDNTPPVATAGTIAACYPTVAAAEAAALAATTATDNCPGTLTETASTVGTCSAVVTVTTSDGCGNSTTTTYNTRIDNTPPTVTPGTIAACYTTVAAAQAAAIAATTATDNCPGTVTKTASTAGLCSAVVTVTATDQCGNSAMTTYTTNIDNTPPTVVCKNSTVFVNSQGSYTLLPSDVFNAAASSDNCPGVLTVVSITPATVDCSLKNQTIPVTVVVADACNNQSTCTAMITVEEDDSLPPGWDNDDVGVANGSAIFSPCTGENGSFVLTSLGFGTPSSDKLHMAYREICGNTIVTARVTNISGSGWGGVMIRETLMPGAKKLVMKTQLSTNIRREIRATTNGATTSLNYIRPGHTWLRLERTGSSFVGYSSTDGVTWNFAFSTMVSMNGCVYVGIFSESINGSTVNTATFDNVTVTGTPNTLSSGSGTYVVSESDDHVQVYPNPTTGEVNINLEAHTGKPGMIQVFNALGEIVTQTRLVAGDLELQKLQITGSAGVYTLVIQLDDRRIVRRVVVDPNGK